MIRIFLFSFLLLSAHLGAIDITASIDGTVVQEGLPIKGTLTITHDKDEAIDENSFLLGTDPLAIEKVKDVEITPHSPIILTIYRFELPTKPVGLYVLPQVSGVIAGKKYRSLATSYEVKKPPNYQETAPKPSPTSSPSVTTQKPLQIPFLRLEASVDGPDTLYPTQRTRLVYRYFFNENIELTQEKLPLLDAAGLVKIGEKQIRDVQDGAVTAREIAQEVEGALPGAYTYGPSIIQGYAYRADKAGDIQSRSELLTSEASTVNVTVLPFPVEGRPQAFNGAVGEFTFTATLQGDREVDVGNDISLDLKIQGKGNIEGVPLPDVCCQPGFVGLFRVSDLPPTVTVKGDTKSAIVVVKPLSGSITQIPPISFSYFNPSTKSYVTLKSDPIDISVKAILPKSMKVKEPGKAPVIFPPPPTIELSLADVTLTQSDLYNRLFGTWWALLILPFGILLLVYQYYLRTFLEERRRLLDASSNRLIRSAKREGSLSPQYFQHLINALKQRLHEAGLIESQDLSIEKWPKEGVCQEVAQWVAHLEETRFSGKSSMDIPSLQADVDKFFVKVPVVSKTRTRDLFVAFVPLLFFIAIIGASFVISLMRLGEDPRLAQAQENYQKGLQASSLYEKQESWLKSAQLYHELADEYRPNYGTGKLDFALGNVYGQLGDTPRAIWHIHRASALSPQNANMESNLQKLQALLYQQGEYRGGEILGLPQWVQLFFAVVLLFIITGTCAIWTRFRWLKSAAQCAVLFVVIAAIPLVYYRYFSPLYGVIMTSTNLRSGPGASYPSIGDLPLGSGVAIEVVGLADGGKWLQVYTAEGSQGYVTSENIRLVDENY